MSLKTIGALCAGTLAMFGLAYVVLHKDPALAKSAAEPAAATAPTPAPALAPTAPTVTPITDDKQAAAPAAAAMSETTAPTHSPAKSHGHSKHY